MKKIFEKYPVLFVYQFGSTIHNHVIAKSDIDIAVFFDKKTLEDHFELRLKLMSELSRFFKKDVDVVVLNDVRSLFFKYNIVKDGKLLFKKDSGTHADFVCRLLSQYFDYKPFLDLYNKRYVERCL